MANNNSTIDTIVETVTHPIETAKNVATIVSNITNFALIWAFSQMSIREQKSFLNPDGSPNYDLFRETLEDKGPAPQGQYQPETSYKRKVLNPNKKY